MVYAANASRAWRGTRLIPTSTLNLNDPPLAIEVLRHGRQIKGGMVPPGGVTSDAVPVLVAPEPHDKILRIMATDLSIFRRHAEALEEEPGNHGRQHRGPGTANNRDKRKAECVFSSLQLSRARDDDELCTTLARRVAVLRIRSGRASHHRAGRPQRRRRGWRGRWGEAESAGRNSVRNRRRPSRGGRPRRGRVISDVLSLPAPGSRPPLGDLTTPSTATASAHAWHPQASQEVGMRRRGAPRTYS